MYINHNLRIRLLSVLSICIGLFFVVSVSSYADDNQYDNSGQAISDQMIQNTSDGSTAPAGNSAENSLENPPVNTGDDQTSEKSQDIQPAGNSKIDLHPEDSQSDQTSVPGSSTPENGENEKTTAVPEADAAGSENTVGCLELEGWHNINGYKYYYNKNGSYYRNEFVSVAGQKYYFDSLGHLVYGAYRYSNGSCYYSDKNGVVITRKGWVTDPYSRKYYVLNGGKLYSGIRVKIGSGNRYYGFDNCGRLFQSEVYSFRGKWYYAAPTGINQYYAKWVTIGDKKYYVRNGGALYTGTRVKIGSGNRYYGFNSCGELFRSKVYSFRGKRYYAGSSGVNQYYAKLIHCDDKTYCCARGGVLYRNRFVTDHGRKYYLGSDGAAKTGWFVQKGCGYFADQSGAVSSTHFGRFTYNGHEYFSLPDGSLYRDTYILLPEGFCYVNKNCMIDLSQKKANPFDRNLYDRLNQANHDFSVTVAENRSKTYSWGWSYQGISLVEMYEATGDTKYLDAFVTQASRVLSTRDSDLGISSFGSSGISLPLWSDSGSYSLSGKYRYPYPVHTGMILLPMLMFADDVKSTPALCSRYDAFADRIIHAAGEAIAAHQKYNVKYYYKNDQEGYFWLKDYNGSLSELSPVYRYPITNMTQIYTASAGLYGKLAGDSTFVSNSERSVRYFKQNTLKYSPQRNSYYWAYCPDNAPAEWDDLSHSYITVLAQDVLHTRCRINVITDSDFERMANSASYIFKIQNGVLLAATSFYPYPSSTQFYRLGEKEQCYSLASFSLLSKYKKTLLTYYGDIVSRISASSNSRIIILPQLTQLMLGCGNRR